MSLHEQSDIRNALGTLAARYSEGLRPQTRRRILIAATEGLGAGRVEKPWLAAAFATRMLAAAAVAAVLLVPALQLDHNRPSGEASGVDNLEVTASGDQIVLTWQDGDQPRRVIRATSREELRHLKQASGVLVNGERWVDTQAGNADIVYYLVE